MSQRSERDGERERGREKVSVEGWRKKAGAGKERGGREVHV